jgi:hypothetical protein
MFACPAFAITAIGEAPAAASFVIAVCRSAAKLLLLTSVTAVLVLLKDPAFGRSVKNV